MPEPGGDAMSGMLSYTEYLGAFDEMRRAQAGGCVLVTTEGVQHPWCSTHQCTASVCATRRSVSDPHDIQPDMEHRAEEDARDRADDQCLHPPTAWSDGDDACESCGEFDDLASELASLLHYKAEKYGDSIGKTEKILAVLYPYGVPRDGIADVLLVTRILDKLCRIAEDNDPDGESPYMDIAGYGLLGVRQGRNGI